MSDKRQSERSEHVRQRVENAREIQAARYKESEGIYSNAHIGTKQIRAYCQINDAGQALLKKAMERLGLSARAYDRILKVARTIADLDASETITTAHLAEAIQYRSLDRENWAG